MREIGQCGEKKKNPRFVFHADYLVKLQCPADQFCQVIKDDQSSKRGVSYTIKGKVALYVAKLF